MGVALVGREVDFQMLDKLPCHHVPVGGHDARGNQEARPDAEIAFDRGHGRGRTVEDRLPS